MTAHTITEDKVTDGTQGPEEGSCRAYPPYQHQIFRALLTIVGCGMESTNCCGFPLSSQVIWPPHQTLITGTIYIGSGHHWFLQYLLLSKKSDFISQCTLALESSIICHCCEWTGMEAGTITEDSATDGTRIAEEGSSRSSPLSASDLLGSPKGYGV